MELNGRNMSEIILVPQVFSDTGRLDYIQDGLNNYSGLEATTKQMEMDLRPFLDSKRGQYNALKILQDIEYSDKAKYLLCTTLDLFIPIFTYVFGLAQLNGNVAIISSHRLENKYYGLPDDEVLLKERLLKEAFHELGHTTGLRHCQKYNCVMANSSTAEDIDVKTKNYCKDCATIFNQYTN